jgi:hypothetical protein
MNFVRLIPMEQDGVTPGFSRIGVNLDKVALVLPGNAPGRTMLVIEGGMQLMVNHTNAEIMSMIEGEVVEANV